MAFGMTWLAPGWLAGHGMPCICCILQLWPRRTCSRAALHLYYHLINLPPLSSQLFTTACLMHTPASSCIPPVVPQHRDFGLDGTGWCSLAQQLLTAAGGRRHDRHGMGMLHAVPCLLTFSLPQHVCVTHHPPQSSPPLLLGRTEQHACSSGQDCRQTWCLIV